MSLGTEAFQFGVISLDGKAFLAVGHFLANNDGDHVQLRSVIDGAADACETCENCIVISDTIVDARPCIKVCHDCLKAKQVCMSCSTTYGLSGDQWKPTRRPCNQCLHDQKHCVRLFTGVLASDCLEKQKKILLD